MAAGPGAPDWTRGFFTTQPDGSFAGTFTDIDGAVDNVSGIRFTVAPDGTITCDPCGPAFQGALGAGRTVSVWTDTWDDGTVELMVAVRQASSYAQSDLTGDWQMQQIGAPPPRWTRGSATIASDGALTGNMTDSDGNNFPVSGVTLTLGSNGIASCTGCGPNFEGILDSDKTAGFMTDGSRTTDQTLGALLRPASSYSQADLTGNWLVHALSVNSSSLWLRGLVTIAADGALSGTLDASDGIPHVTVGKLLVAPDGTITHDTAPDMRCALDAGKTVMVCTNTE
ncbi:MAG: hypothetical protein D6815_11780 [Candidatus Dadabacteria bacterium]|nr:MAG: hypothetical protein D6815_11780 [Candidatus Dadabacteria bacterium]